MAADPSVRDADWRDAGLYSPLLAVGRSGLAWEWLRRHPDYRAAALPLIRERTTSALGALSSETEASEWGLHAFEDPHLSAPVARPVWRTGYFPVVEAMATAEAASADRFDLDAHRRLATLVEGADGTEHLLLSDGHAGLRLDILRGSILDGPVELDFRLSGFTGLEQRLAALRRLLRLQRTGKLGPPDASSRNARLVLLLRAHDALAAGATQKEIASELLGRSTLPRRWRIEDPSLRLRAQRLALGARKMARGGWMRLLRQDA